MSLQSKRVALVTGANRGIGLEISRQLAKLDYSVILGCRNEEKGRQAERELTAVSPDVSITRLNVNDPTSIVAAAARIRDQFERLDVLVNNAGIMIDGAASILDLPLTLLQNTLETNSYGPLLLSQTCIPIMRSNGYGRIVNIASTLGTLSEIASPESSSSALNSPAYRLSKIMLNGITALLAREVKGENILVNSVCPGWVRTDLGGAAAPLTPAQAAETPVWLATLPDDGPTGGFFREHQPIPW